ncbi:hypothetical protein [Agrococcus casei]|uniref:hypothetical protein n=1 Tax=Agrococcus casei TaxID=343512 RepID=UPI003F8F1662
MFERKRIFEDGKSEPEWMRRASDQLGDHETVKDDDVVESIGHIVPGLETFSTLLGTTVEADSCTIDGDCTSTG